MSTHYLFRELQPVSTEAANEKQTALLSSAKKQVGFIPNMYRNMVNTPAFLDTYLHGYNAFRGQSDFTPAEQEVVFLALSKSNGCDYCMAAHSTLAANFSGVPANILSAIRSDTKIPDAKIAALYAMAVEINESRGRPNPKSVEGFLSVGYSEKDIMAIILALSVKILSNYSNHLFDTDVDEAFSEYAV